MFHPIFYDLLPVIKRTISAYVCPKSIRNCCVIKSLVASSCYSDVYEFSVSIGVSYDLVKTLLYKSVII